MNCNALALIIAKCKRLHKGRLPQELSKPIIPLGLLPCGLFGTYLKICWERIDGYIEYPDF